MALVNKYTLSRRVYTLISTLLFLAFCFLWVYPMWYVLIQSLSSGVSTIQSMWLPQRFTLKNYIDMLRANDLNRAVTVSVGRTAVGTMLVVIANMLLGYLFTRKDLPFRKFFYRLLLVTGYVSGGLIPGFLLYKNLGMLNTFWVYVIPGMISFGNVILIKTFIEQLPFSVQESAMMDGASDLTLFSKIIMPMSLPIVATIALFAAIGQWNSWFDTVAYAWANPNLKTLQSILREYMTQNDKMIALIKELGLDIDMSKYLTPWNARMTIVMITVVPVLLVYPILQRYYVKGIFIGAVKGM